MSNSPGFGKLMREGAAEWSENLRWYRRAANVTQGNLAIAAGVSRSTIQRWEKGKGCPNAEELRKIADKLGCRSDDIVFTQDERKVRGKAGIYDPEVIY